MHSDTGSNICLVTCTKYPHNWVEHKGIVNGAGGGIAMVTACGDLHAQFIINDMRCRIIAHKCYVMPLNNHHALGLAPFKKAGCSKTIHDMHKQVEFHLENGQIKESPITIISNSLDYAALEIVPPPNINESSDEFPK